MTPLPPPPPDVPVINSLDGLAPKFRDALTALCNALSGLGWQPVLRETLRTNERATYLYGFGRVYDDGRGIVTNATDASHTWHAYGVAADVGDKRHDAGQEPAAFWRDLEICAVRLGLVSGADWTFCDKPHVQLGAPMRASPSDEATRLLQEGGTEAVWRAVGGI